MTNLKASGLQLTKISAFIQTDLVNLSFLIKQMICHASLCLQNTFVQTETSFYLHIPFYIPCKPLKNNRNYHNSDSTNAHLWVQRKSKQLCQLIVKTLDKCRGNVNSFGAALMQPFSGCRFSIMSSMAIDKLPSTPPPPRLHCRRQCLQQQQQQLKMSFAFRHHWTFDIYCCWSKMVEEEGEKRGSGFEVR